MTVRGSNRVIVAKSDRCHGCLTCQLRCSLRATGKFNPSEAKIKITQLEGGYKFRHTFTDECDGCGGDYLCVHWCPYGTLGLERI